MRSIIILVFLSIAFAIVYNSNRHDIWAWGLTNVPIAIPFFLLGHICSTQFRKSFDKFCNSVKNSNPWITICIIFSLFVIVYLFSMNHSERLNMFKAYYEGNILLVYALGIIGSTAILLGSLLLDKIHLASVYILSAGTLLILGFHRDIAHPLEKPFEHLTSGTLAYDGSMFLISIVVMVVFIPIVILVGKYIPFLLGNRLHR